MANFSPNEPRSICVSVSKRNQEAVNIAESKAMEWNMGMGPTLWRIVREYNQMKKWSIYNQ